MATDSLAPLATNRIACAWVSLALVVIVIVASSVRFWNLGAGSLWFDEVITIRVAKAGGPGAVLRQLNALDGTRAPLHPLLLSGWISLFGTSEAAGRSLSALLGVATVLVVFSFGRTAFNPRTGLWAAWLAALCPPLIYYSRELRMYSWLVFVTCLSWLLLLSFRDEARRARCALYALLLAALAYSHPVGLFMIIAHGLAYLMVRKELRLDVRTWLAIQVAVVLAITPWIGQYLNRTTDYPIPRYGPLFLIAVPIEYIGGNKWVLLGCFALIVHGLVWHARDGRRGISLGNPLETTVLVAWLTIPPILLYAYSYAMKPIFGPPRYHLFIAPAYLILLARGLDRLPVVPRWGAAIAMLYCSITLLSAGVYAQPLKADWKGLSAWLDEQAAARGDPKPTETASLTVVIHPSDPRFPREECEAARYYLGGKYRVEASHAPLELEHDSLIYDVHCHSAPQASPPPSSGSGEFLGISVRLRASPDRTSAPARQ